MNIAILGGGVGGLSTAIALKLKGFDVTVYERHKNPCEIGAGIVCWPNACFVLNEIGILDKIKQVSGSLQSMNRYSDKGEPIGSLNITELSRLMHYPSYSILRKDLMTILNQRAIELKMDLKYEYNVSKIIEQNNGATVKFSNGQQIQADIIIGADGRMNSIARAFVNKDNTPIYQGFINWIGVFESQSPVFNELSVSDYWGIGERFGIVPVSSTQAYWAGGIKTHNENDRDPSKYKSELNSIFANWPGLIARIISETPSMNINKIYVHDHDPINQWYRNNVVLLGDAAHSSLPTSGQGACQALEDAWHFANCLTENNDNILKAFSLFTNIRKDKTMGITMGARQLASSIFSQDKAFCSERNLASKTTNYQEMVVGMAKGWSSGLKMGI